MYANLQDKTWYGVGAPSGVLEGNPMPPGGIYINMQSGAAYANIGTLLSPSYASIGSGGGGGNWWETALPEGQVVIGTVPDYSAGSGMPAGSQPLISLEQMDAGGGNLYDALVIGGDGPLGSEIVFDPFWNGELYSYADYVAGMGDFDPATGRGQDGNNHTVQAALGFGAYDVANVRLFGASTHPSNPGELQILVKGLATAFPAVDAMWKDGDVLRTGNGDMNISSGLIINAVPAEPAIAGKVWEWSGDITALTTYLAGGGRLAALGNP